MAKSATPDVFDKSDEIEAIKNSSKPKPKAKPQASRRRYDDEDDLEYETSKGTLRRKTAEDDKIFPVRISKRTHRRLREAAWDLDESMNLVAARAIQEYLNRNGF